MKVTRKTNRSTTEATFHLIRALTPEHNLRRLRVYLARLDRTPGQHRWLRANRLKNRIRAMKASA